jgi:hypothetical protein
MPGRPRGRFKHLDERQREALAEYLAARIDYLRAERRYTQQILNALQAPNRGDNKRIRQFVSDVLAPARGRMRTAQLSAMSEAMDVDRLADLVPGIVGGVAQAVDIPMLFAALNIDTDLTDQIVDKATPVVRRLMATAARNRQTAG